MARISGVFTSPARKSGVSVSHERRHAIAGEGLEGCAHANPPKREVLFVSKEHLDSVGVEPGAIRENLTVEGTDVEQWPIGQRVKVGDEAVFEITMVCDPCHRMDELRDGLRAELAGQARDAGADRRVRRGRRRRPGRAGLAGASSRPRPCPRPRVGAAVEPAVAADDLEAGLLEQRAPLVGREPGEHEARPAALAADRQRQRARLRVPLGALEDPRLALEPAAVRVRDVARARARRRRRRAARAGTSSSRAAPQRAQPRVVVEQVQVRAERAGDERDPLLDRRRLAARQPQVEQLARRPPARARSAADLEHPRRGVDADHADAGRRGRHRDPARADAELDHRRARRARPPRRRSRRPR